MAIQSIHKLWAAAQHLFWLTYKEACKQTNCCRWARRKEEDLTRMEQRSNNGWSAPCEHTWMRDYDLQALKINGWSTEKRARLHLCSVWPLTEATKTRQKPNFCSTYLIEAIKMKKRKNYHINSLNPSLSPWSGNICWLDALVTAEENSRWWETRVGLSGWHDETVKTVNHWCFCLPHKWQQNQKV